MTKNIITFLVFLSLGFVVACGNGGEKTPPPAQKVSVSVSPTSAAVPNPATTPQSNPSPTINKADLANTGLQVNTNFADMTLILCRPFRPHRPPWPSVTPNLPYISASLSTANVVPGDSLSFGVSVCADSAPTVTTITCSVSGAGSCSMSGNTGTYSVPSAQPSSFLAIVTVTATSTNSAGSVSSTTQLTINLVPKILSVSQNTISCTVQCGAVYEPVIITLTVAGVYPGATNLFHNLGQNGILLWSVSDPTHVMFLLNFDTPHWAPRFFHVWFSNPSGASGGGGDSNKANFAFLGNQNVLAFSDTEIFFLHQADPATLNGVSEPSGAVYVFRLSDGSFVRKFPTGGLIYGISVDDVKKYVVWTQFNGVQFGSVIDNSGGGSGSNGYQSYLAVSAKGGYACVSQNTANQVVSADLSKSNPPLVPAFVGDTPWGVAMTNLGGSQACAVFNAGDDVLSAVTIPQMSPIGNLFLTGFTPFSQLTNGQGGWQLSVSGSNASVLARADSTLVFADMNTWHEIARKKLDGAPMRIANNSDGSVIVAFADVDAGLTRFSKAVANADGSVTVTPFIATAPFLASGLGVSANGRIVAVGLDEQLVPHLLFLN